MAWRSCWLLTLICLMATDFCICQEGPKWIHTLKAELQAGIQENAPIFTSLGMLLAESRKNPPGSIVYATDSDIVGVQAESGNVFLNAPLDREKKAEHLITFYAFDDSGDSAASQVTVTLVVLDVNDNEPRFLRTPYTFSLSETTSTGAVVFDGVTVTDADIGENAEITLSCTPKNSEDILSRAACDTFHVQTLNMSPGIYKGEIILKKSLSYAEHATYSIPITAQDKGVPSLSSQQVITVLVQEANVKLQQPTFLNEPLQLVIYENREEFTRSVQVRAGNAADSVTIRIKSDPMNYFTISETVNMGKGLFSADLKTKGRLDREALESSTYVFIIEASERTTGETVLQTEASVSVEVIDVNDNVPKFDKDMYVMSIREDQSSEGLLPQVITVTDADMGDNAYLTMSLEGDGAEYFALSPSVVTQRGDIRLKLVQAPDYDDGMHQINLVIKARETETAQQYSATASIIINVEDVNDNDPLFQMDQYTAYIREDRPVGYSIIRIEATDLDTSFGPLTYSLSGTHSDKFRVNAATGEVFLAKKLDFEQQNVYRLSFTATDSGGRSSTTSLRIEVLDFNDQGPVFDRDEYKALADETITVLQPNVTVKAVDQETDEDVTYRIVNGDPTGAFSIGRKTGVLQLLRPLSYEETDNGIVTLTIEASDNGFPPQVSTVPVVITVLDENNHSPVFANTTYYKTISETAPGNTPVVQVRASDLDSGTNGKLTYIIYSGSRDNFVINEITGLISVSESANLDIDVSGKNYDVTVLAVDQGSPQRTATAQVYITVLEANNKDPVFGQDFYTFTIMDTVSIGTRVDTVIAHDPDGGSKIQYSIQPGSIMAKDKSGKPVTSTYPINYKTLFTIDRSSGLISTNGKLDRDYVAEVSFTVQAEDVNGQTTHRQIATADVIITIRSTKDNELTFNAPWTSQNPVITVYIPEEEPAATLVTRVIATDPEMGVQVRDYRKVFGSDPQSFFTLDHQTGKIYLNKRMDFENPNTRQKSFRVEAYTQPPNVRSAMATVTVITTDINDHEPKFSESKYVFDASESLNPGSQIGVVLATDEDSGEFGKITYSLSGIGSDVFTINPEQGYIEIAENHKLDRELVANYYLIVQAKDQGGKYTEVPLQIRVLDENDNKPQFTSSEYNMYTLEYVGPLTSLGQVHATDPDEGANGAVTYRILNIDEPVNSDGVKLGDLFTIETTTGIIRSRIAMDGYARNYPYSLTVEAQDGGSGGKRLKALTTAQIHISDVVINDGRPVISYPPEDGLVITVPENASVGENITQIIAKDSDLGPEGELEIGFVPNEALAEDHSFFNIDPDSGLITIKRNLDRELKQTYQLLVYVKDKGSPPNVITRKLTVRVTDVDDNSPSFADTKNCPDLYIENPLYASVKEEAPVGTYVTTVRACDPDEPPYNKIYYFIVCGNQLDDETTAFKIDKNTGVISTNSILDREQIPEFRLCVYASSVENPNITIIRNSDTKRQKREVNQEPSILIVIVKLEDINDNGPAFPTDPGRDHLVIGLPSNLPYGSDVVRMAAVDPDGHPDFKYGIASITFTDDRQKTKPVNMNYFIIDQVTGVIRTGRENYEKFRGGSFRVVVDAFDSERRMASTYLIIYVLSAGQRLRFRFKETPPIVNDWYSDFIKQMNMYLKPEQTVIKADTLKHAIDNEGKAIYNQTDVCFHMLQNNQVMGQRHARQILDTLDTNKAVMLLYDKYNMTGLDACEPHVTTIWWSGWWWLWWLLIACAIFIILMIIIVLIIICCCWPKYKTPLAFYEKPYVVVDPVTVAPPNYGFEWQEEVVKMN